MHSPRQHLSRKLRLRLWIALFFIALTIPSAYLIQHAYSQLKWEAFHLYRVQAEEFANRVDRRLAAMMENEQGRSFGDYAFLTASVDPPSGFLQLSPLSVLPVDTGIPGLIGYFQIDPGGQFSSPLLPGDGRSMALFGIPGQEADQRRQLQQRIFEILDENRLVRKDEAGSAADGVQSTGRFSRDDDKLVATAPSVQRKDGAGTAIPEAEEIAGQSAFDRLNAAIEGQRIAKQKAGALGRVEDLKLDTEYQDAPSSAPVEAPARQRSAAEKERTVRTEKSALLEKKSQIAEESDMPVQSLVDEAVIEIFESKIDAFDFASLASGHFVLFRNVWHDSERYVQGAIIDSATFIRDSIETEFRRTALAVASDLVVAYGGDVYAALSGKSSREYLSSTDELQGTLLFKTRLSVPLHDMELIFSVTRLPAGPGGTVVFWVAAILFLVLAVGSYLMYRMGAAQIELARQQQDFISAVSHELKTPLTSIRMYSEMLNEGWADEEKKKNYYSYISAESERLSRLISNVLQLTRLNRNGLQLELKPVRVSELMQNATARISSQVEGAGFELEVDTEDPAGEALIRVDPDAFVQIVINLVDNAIKFSANAESRRVDLSCDRMRDDSIRFTVRDYGPGVPRDQMQQIFKLFYRSGDELTRDTVGTGIGLALVNQLAHAMHGRVDVINREPGAEFVLFFPGSVDHRSRNQDDG